ncbi:M56 family metallopeptidase [Sphingopyxis flava]|uniref:Signal transducer regulating beta-lactamase production, contains metallopeptidase domain n=1 Tax=Sphingopyxis flava TaxID=1507287 RepID=A0A1T5C3Q6_9SPHN|nr:M56 family metallopeptidase [Sphingopyxis flava]SKB54044.1 Signal transducer regulating beta-lactamase production, contains metallopeptidase domain [Sphingopyxis flava]
MITATVLAGVAWKSALIAGLTLLLLRFARTRSAAERSLIAHVGLAALLALPVATLLLPIWAPLPAAWFAGAGPAAAIAPGAGPVAADFASAAASVPAAAERAAAPASWLASLPALPDLAPWVYALPLALLFATMLVAVARLFAMRARADVLVQPSWLSALAEAQRRMGFKHGTALLVSEELRSPISWGVLRPTIVLSPKAVEAVGEAEAIIAHELAHVARRDWAKLLAARLACAIFWFNPLVWMLARESHQLREEAADDAVLLADIDGPDYATLLVGAARHDNKGTLIAAHGVAPGKNSLKRRITRVLDARAKRGPASASWFAMALAFLAGVTVPLAAFSATGARSADEPGGGIAVAAPAAAPKAAASAQGREARASAQTELAVDELVSMKAMGITPDDVRGMRGAKGLDPDDVIAAKATGTAPAYLNRMRALFPNADMDDLIGASVLGIDTSYAREMQSYFPGLDLDDLAGMRAVGVTGSFVREMRKSGVRVSDPDDAIELRVTRGVNVSQIVSHALTTATRATSVSVGGDGVTPRAEPPQPPGPPQPPATND